MKRSLRAVLAISAIAVAGHAAAEITFYEGEGYRGRVFSTDTMVPNMARTGFNDRASSVVVDRGSWEVCEHARFEGRCAVLRRGSYPSLRHLGMENAISSVRRVEEGRQHGLATPEPLAAPDYEYRRRPEEAVFEAPVTSVRAVVGPPTQRCWIERQQVQQPSRGEPNIGGAIVGGVIGGILGHQVGGGSGKDLATAGGAVAGAAIGANTGRSGGGSVVDRDVQRCESVSSTRPEYWDVTYNYQGVEHRVQMSAPPGRTIAVNRFGEPRH